MSCTVHVNVAVESSRHRSRRSFRDNRSASETWILDFNWSYSTVNASWGISCLQDCGFTACDCHQRNLFHEFLCTDTTSGRSGEANCNMHKQTLLIIPCVSLIVVSGLFWDLANNIRRTMKISLALPRSTWKWECLWPGFWNSMLRSTHDCRFLVQLLNRAQEKNRSCLASLNFLCSE